MRSNQAAIDWLDDLAAEIGDHSTRFEHPLYPGVDVIEAYPRKVKALMEHGICRTRVTGGMFTRKTDKTFEGMVTIDAANWPEPFELQDIDIKMGAAMGWAH